MPFSLAKTSIILLSLNDTIVIYADILVRLR